MRELSHPPLSDSLIEGPERAHEPPGFGFRQHIRRSRLVPVERKSTTEDLTGLQPPEVDGRNREKTERRRTFGDHLINGEFNAEHLADCSQPFLPVPAMAFEMLRIA